MASPLYSGGRYELAIVRFQGEHVAKIARKIAA